MTVLLPVHNGAKYLARSLDSVLAQVGIEFLVHVLDDESTDDSAAIARAYGDSRLVCSKNPRHWGLFRTLNRGFEESRSEYIRLWAQDDVMVPGSLARFVEFADHHPSAGMVYSDFFDVDENGHRTGREERFRGPRSRTPEIAESSVAALLFWVYGCLPGNISTVLMRRDAWAAVGGFLTGREQAPDFDMWVRLSAVRDVGFIREKLVELRNHPAQHAKVGQRRMTSIEEELSVRRLLEDRLSGITTRRELQYGWLTGRGRQHAHWVMRALLRGDLASAIRGLRSMAQYGAPLPQILYWALSCNGQLHEPDLDERFDRLVKRLKRRI